MLRFDSPEYLLMLCFMSIAVKDDNLLYDFLETIKKKKTQGQRAILFHKKEGANSTEYSS